MADKKDEEKKEDDDRIEFLYKYLVLSRKIKLDKWVKMLTNEEYKETVMKFFDTPSEMILIIQLNPAGVLVPFLEIPPTGWVKASYFIKKDPVEITKENYRNVIIPGDMASKPIEELSVLVEEAYVPILSNPKNHKGWPRVIGEDMKKHVYDLRNMICQVKGKMMGQTLLPMPMGIEQIFEAEWKAQQSGGVEVDLPLKSNIETIVTKWCSQIGDTLNEESPRNDKQLLPSAGIAAFKQN
ncbi:dynein beta chain, ciliary-like [Temnothorax nylanderi]|uniref:dynein beta chain, ciliary-like n=1 Tax=Temnothorax nylanderi TaxID=102681 RepID=UPI003A875DF7